MTLLNRLFNLDQRRTTVARELRGAVATFLTMAYILVANPAILAAAGVPQASAVACTAAAAGLCCLLMGFVSNFPLALASGMGLNAFVAYNVTKLTGSWQAAMGLVVLDGVVILTLVLCGLREAMVHAIPVDLRRAIGAGIGLFIALIGAVNAGLVLHQAPPAPPVTYGSLTTPTVGLALFGLVVIAVLLVRRVTGAIVVGILVSTLAAVVCDLAIGTELTGDIAGGLAPPSFEAAFQADVRAVLHLKFLPALIALLMVDFFDTLGTVTALADQAGLVDNRGRIPGLRRILLVDSLSASIGGLFGASSVTSYIESAAGIAEGARTGLHSVFVGLMFLACIVLAPLAALVPAAATAPALVIVGFLMCEQLTRIDLKQLDTAIPAFLIAILIPFTYSIAHGIGYGFLAYVAIKLLTLRIREIHPLMAGAAAVFLAYFVWGE
jgi:AGZA family xanthine/uracil permease-like MFS transporter